MEGKFTTLVKTVKTQISVTCTSLNFKPTIILTNHSSEGGCLLLPYRQQLDDLTSLVSLEFQLFDSSDYHLAALQVSNPLFGSRLKKRQKNLLKEQRRMRYRRVGHLTPCKSLPKQTAISSYLTQTRGGCLCCLSSGDMWEQTEITRFP
ncbi:hypothetical protein CDAR_419881 [Caerostris darwini]|uniref:Uncharacterized protein n=1 Tax=Caerostris darwini TaxID=1538125 RepID=A0AAV4RMU1_9ARAC|nr:hypothetical protein CDAR_419881 [Caerostris darwini]